MSSLAVPRGKPKPEQHPPSGRTRRQLCMPTDVLGPLKARLEKGRRSRQTALGEDCASEQRQRLDQGNYLHCDDRKSVLGLRRWSRLRDRWCLSRLSLSSNRTSSFSQSPFPAYRPAAPHGQGPGWKAASPRRRPGFLLPRPPLSGEAGGKECGRPGRQWGRGSQLFLLP